MLELGAGTGCSCPVFAVFSGLFSLYEDDPLALLDDLAGLVVDVYFEYQKAHVRALVLPLFDELTGDVNRVAELDGARETPVFEPHEGYRREAGHREPEPGCNRKDAESVRHPALEHGVLGELLVYVHVVKIAREAGEAAARAQLDAAEAAVNSAKVELGRTQIRAPFDGVFEKRLAEAGDYLGPGSACGVLVDLSPVIVAAEVSEAEAGLLKPGMPGTVLLADGRTFPAKLRYVARTASEQTRTFPIEAELVTGDAPIAAGAINATASGGSTGSAK